MRKTINIILSLAVVFLTVWFIRIIKEPLVRHKNMEKRKHAVIAKLEQIKLAQLAYKAIYGRFTDNWDSLVCMINSGSFKIIKPQQTDADNEVIRFDTIFVPVKDSAFYDGFYADSLKFVPYGNGAIFLLEAGTVFQNGLEVWVFQVTDTRPFDPEKVLQLGSMSEVKYTGNW